MGEDVTLAKVLAFAIILAGALALGLSAWIVVNYFRAYRARPDKDDWRGLLPRHVILIGLSYDLYVSLVMAAHVARINEPATWRTPLYVVASVLGLWALRDMTASQRYRKVRLPGEGSKPR